ncbi:MAG: hypothetical protein ABI690_13515 [Chloroflexota bacterium]
MDTIGTLDGVEGILDAPVLFRDCAFPITDARKYCPPDDVLNNFPVYIGSWEDDMLAPAISSQAIDIDASALGVDSSPCETAIVTVDMDSCSLVAPNQKKIKLRTDTLDWTKLVARFCKMRNISKAQLGTIILPNGQFDLGNPYTPNFARFAMAAVAQALMKIVSKSVLTGDFSERFQIDGLYTQLAGGWSNPSSGTPCPAAINVRQVINWSTLTGGNGTTPASPDAVTTAQNATIWGVSRAIPAGLNLAEFLEELWFPAVEANYTDVAGGVSMWEAHVPQGQATCFLKTAACMQPCQVTGEFDPELRARYAAMRNTKIAELYPSGRSFPLMESNSVVADTMWIGPREIGGRPTYGAFFTDLNQYFNQLGLMMNQYGKAYGLPEQDPLLGETTPIIDLPFESQAIQQDVLKPSIDCVQFALMAIYGVLVVSRHLWLEINHIACPTIVDACANDIVITEPEEA